MKEKRALITVSLCFILMACTANSAIAKEPLHTVYGPEYVGYNDYLRVSLDTACNVFAVDAYNYARYKRGENFKYYGGYAKESPVILRPPSGSYYVVIDNGGASYRLRASVQVISER